MNKTLAALDAIQNVIGTPEENRDILVKSILLDKKMTCNACCASYQSGADMELMTVKLGGSFHARGGVGVNLTSPSNLIVDLRCHCGHEGRIVLRPNPLILGHSI